MRNPTAALARDPPEDMSEAPFRVFVTGTDTGVGKTEVSCALLSLLVQAGLHPAPFKPYETGCGTGVGEDVLAMREAARSRDHFKQICPHPFALPLAPGVAARRLGIEPNFRTTIAAFESFGDRPLVAEGAGGLRVPIDSEHDVIDLIARLQLPAVLVARAGLGTLNHTALSVDALRQHHIDVLAVVLAQATEATDLSMEDNAPLIAERHRVCVLGPVLFEPDPRRRRRAFERALAPLLHR